MSVTMKFVRFGKLTNTYCNRTIQRIRRDGFDKGDWVITEKLDGANFSLWYNGDDFKVASRNQFVDGTFFNSQQIINLYKEPMIEYYHECLFTGKLSQGDVLTITGELVGEGILNRVKYDTPDGLNRAFYAFDTSINNESMGYMYTYDNINFVPCVPLIDICSFDEALEISPDFQSHLTPVGVDSNHSEGLTLSPVIPKYFSTGLVVHLKNKSKNFLEIEKAPRRARAATVLSEFDTNRLDELLQYLNKNRVLSALSKFGEVQQSNFGKILQDVLEDIFEDFREDFEYDPVQGVENWKGIMIALKREASKEVREEFIQVVN